MNQGDIYYTAFVDYDIEAVKIDWVGTQGAKVIRNNNVNKKRFVQFKHLFPTELLAIEEYNRRIKTRIENQVNFREALMRRQKELLKESERCYFCKESGLIHFHEHYHFCPECSAIYTFMITSETNCSHIKSGVPVAERVPWFKSDREANVYIDVDHHGHWCSVCRTPVKVGGW